MFGTKIKLIREVQGLSQENIAYDLGISQSAYSKIESNQTKLSAEMLVKLAEVLKVDPMDIISQQPAIINNASNTGTQQAFGYVENFISSQKELLDEVIKAKDAEIARLSGIIDQLLKKN